MDNNKQTNRPYWKHQPIGPINHFGTKFSISENGLVTISTSSPDPKDKDGVIIDEVSVSAGLIFKIASYLKDTRVAIERVEEKNEKNINQG